MCPPVLVRALYAMWADTQVRPYTNHIKTKISAIRRCSTSICRETHESVESEGVRGVKGYSIVALTGTDAIPLDTSERPYKGLPVLR